MEQGVWEGGSEQWGEAVSKGWSKGSGREGVSNGVRYSSE
jgi:hypothetical protein